LRAKISISNIKSYKKIFKKLYRCMNRIGFNSMPH
jgi:hypothetical protein